ncbi:myeloid differentiation primary response protein MyD88 [Leptopilina boulardi]|uniref:myeloid differentiation primary response protein MyD88 n=1 Tax=Leptopilina boulardi TaxID=63433 RepID=UPI0021F5750D|nr:myeloid differentiation primary response protein MyD88 [Leptopilina boulardi]
MDMLMVPILALSENSKILISTLLNPIKVLPTNKGLPRDWRGLVHVFELPGEIIPLLYNHKNPFEGILEKIDNKATLKDLQNAFKTIERWDVFDDTEPLIEKDVQDYAENLKRSQKTAEAIWDNNDSEILTIGDQYRSRQGLEKQHYDAFILYADEDYDFALRTIEELEKEDLKVCTKDRDLIAGISIENEVIMTLISKRCNRLIVIISPNFFKSPANTFFLEFAYAVGIKQRVKKLIACIYIDCELPESLNYITNLRYSRRELINYWEKLCDSVRSSPQIKESQSTKKEIKKKKNENCVALHDNITKEEETKIHLPKSNSSKSLSKYLFGTGKTDKKANNQIISKNISDEQNNDSGLSLPSVPSDSISLSSNSSNIPLSPDAKKLLPIKKDKKKKDSPLKEFFRRKK